MIQIMMTSEISAKYDPTDMQFKTKTTKQLLYSTNFPMFKITFFCS